jgi:hypothetical protein
MQKRNNNKYKTNPTPPYLRMYCHVLATCLQGKTTILWKKHRETKKGEERWRENRSMVNVWGRE